MKADEYKKKALENEVAHLKGVLPTIGQTIVTQVAGTTFQTDEAGSDAPANKRLNTEESMPQFHEIRAFSTSQRIFTGFLKVGINT